jgi:hypothetical protein
MSGQCVQELTSCSVRPAFVTAEHAQPLRDAKSQSLIVPSMQLVASREPSGEKLTELTQVL